MSHAIVERKLVGSIWLVRIKADALAEAGDAALFAKESPWLSPAAIKKDIYWEVDHAAAAGGTGRHFFGS